MRDSRREQMATFIAQKHTATMTELCQAFQVSINTVRADVAYLVQTGAVEKVYGGVRSMIHQEVPLFTQRTGLHTDEKNRIARQAEQCIADQDILYIDAGTTTMHLLNHLAPSKHITILTGNLHLVSQAYNMPNVNLIILPGSMNRRTNSVTDVSALEFLGRYHFTKAFMGVSSISSDGALNVSSYMEYELKRAAVHQCQHAYLLADSSKFGGTGLMSYGALSDIEEIITDEHCPQQIRTLCAEQNIRLTIAE